MNPRLLRILGLLRTPAAIVFGTLLLASSASAQTRPTVPESPYGGTTVEEIIARVNDQVITRSDYERAMKEMDAEARKNGASMQEISAGHNDLLRGLIDRQLWISKGKELGITGETELINKLNEIRKQYNLETLEDLEKEAKDQGVSFEDFKANIRNTIITQDVMRQEVGRKIAFTPGEAERYFEAHKQEYAQQESIHLSEILVAIGAPDTSGDAQTDDPAKLAAAKAKADDIAAKLHAGGDFGQLARTFSDGSTAAQGGDLGQYLPGSMAKVLEDKTFSLKAGEFTEPIRTKQGYVILKVTEHKKGGTPAFKDVEPQVEDAFYMSRMEPAIREYLTTMREQAYIDIKPGFTDTGASAKQTKPVYSAYVPPAPKKKKKVQRTRFRETTHTFRQKSKQAAPEAATKEAVAPAPTKRGKKNKSAEPVNLATMKPGKKEKIRFGKAPQQTLPQARQTAIEDAGAGSAVAANAPQEPVNPLEEAAPTKKSRFSERAKTIKQAKVKGPKPDPIAPAPPDASEVADRQTQAQPLGLAGDTANKKKKKDTTSGNKTRLSGKKKEVAPQGGDAPLGPAPTPPPAATPAPAPAPPASPAPQSN
jgi:peptidyl-prolyl cis-trans isomerase SurA